MIVNPSKFQVIVLSKSKQSIDTTFVIEGHQIKSSDCVKLLGISIDDKLSFDKHVSKLCKKLSKKLSINSFIYSNLNYCPLVWHFMSASNTKKVERIHERALRFLYGNVCNTSYEGLLRLSGKTSMFVSRIKCLCTEIYKNH